MSITSMNGSRYVLTFIDDFSRYTWVFFIKKKSEVLEKFTELKALIENASGKNIKILVGSISVMSYYIYVPKLVFISNIQFLTLPSRNGVAERKNRSLKEMTTCMLETKKLAGNLLDEDMHDTEYI